MNKIFKLSVLPFAMFLGSSAVNAAMPGAYVGGGMGVGVVGDYPEFEKDRDGAFAGRAFLGYNFNRYLGVEANYTAFDTIKLSSSYYYNLFYDYDFNAVSVVGKAYLPISDSGFNLYALFGGAYAHNKVNALHYSRKVGSFSASGLVPTGGFGATYDINKKFTVGLEISAFGEKNSSTSDLIDVAANGVSTLSLAYKF